MDLMDLMEFYGIQVRMKIKRDREEAGRLGRPGRPVSWEEGKLGGLGAAKLRRWGLGGQEVQEARGRRKLGCCMANCEAGRVRSWCGCGERGAPKLDPKWAPKWAPKWGPKIHSI